MFCDLLQEDCSGVLRFGTGRLAWKEKRQEGLWFRLALVLVHPGWDGR